MNWTAQKLIDLFSAQNTQLWETIEKNNQTFETAWKRAVFGRKTSTTLGVWCSFWNGR